MTIQIVQPNQVLIVDSAPIHSNPYRRFFDFAAARRAMSNHVSQLPSDTTPEKHTRNNYNAGLDKFLDFLDDRLPTKELMQEYIAQLRQRGLKSTTIASSYLAPARHFCRALSEQPLPFETATDGKILFELSVALPEWRERIRQAAAIKNPAAETTSRISPLFDPRFIRLELTQVNAVLRSLDTQNLTNLRNYAILHIAFTTALRLAEIQRMTLNSLSQEGNTWLVTVRGKRSNIDPVPTSTKAVEDIFAYVERFNADLDPDDPRRIAGDTPLWQPLLKNGAHLPVADYAPATGITKEALRKIIASRTKKALGDKFELAAHDTRRTAAYIAFRAGMPLPEIQKLLRHKNPATTLRYIGQEPNYGAANMTSYGINFG